MTLLSVEYHITFVTEITDYKKILFFKPRIPSFALVTPQVSFGCFKDEKMLQSKYVLKFKIFICVIIIFCVWSKRVNGYSSI